LFNKKAHKLLGTERESVGNRCRKREEGNTIRLGIILRNKEREREKVDIKENITPANKIQTLLVSFCLIFSTH
jgi:hypothetical protein